MLCRGGITLEAAHVAAFLEDRPTLEDVQVTFHKSDVVAITAYPVIAGFSLPSAARIHLRGYLVPQGSQLRLNITDLRAAGGISDGHGTDLYRRAPN